MVEFPARLMSDYGVDVPVWSSSARVFDEESAADRLSPELVADLKDWQRVFDENFHWDHGWRNGAAEAEYAHRAPVLRDRVAWELGEHVELDLWPVTDPAPRNWLNGQPARPGWW